MEKCKISEMELTLLIKTQKKDGKKLTSMDLSAILHC